MVYPGSPLLLTHSIRVGEHGLDVRCAARTHLINRERGLASSAGWKAAGRVRQRCLTSNARVAAAVRTLPGITCRWRWRCANCSLSTG
jgi:hypothetical protein